ncbi:MAG: hypothetical protein ACTSR2_01105 [Candidatus Hodarchaeales archaeon]
MKGSVFDTTFVGIFAFIALVVFGVAWLAISDISTEFQALNFPEQSYSWISGLNETIDFGLFLTIFFFSLSSIVLAYKVKSHPVMFSVVFILLILVNYINVKLGNAWNAIVSEAPMAKILLSFPLTAKIVVNFPLYSVVISFIIAIAMFVRKDEFSKYLGW